MAYQYTNSKGQNYCLHSKDVRLRSGQNQRIYYFAREIKSEAVDQLPAGMIVVENKKTGLPVLKKS